MQWFNRRVADVSFRPVLVRAAKRRDRILPDLKHVLSIRTILVRAAKRRGWLLPNHQQHGLPLGSILERHQLCFFHHDHLPFGSILEWDELREFHDHHLSSRSVLERHELRNVNVYAAANHDHMPCGSILEWDSVRFEFASATIACWHYNQCFRQRICRALYAVGGYL